LEDQLKNEREALKSKEKEMTLLSIEFDDMNETQARAIADMEVKMLDAQEIAAEREKIVIRSRSKIETLQIEVLSNRATISSLTSEISKSQERVEAQEKELLKSEDMVPRNEINGSKIKTKIQPELNNITDDTQAKSEEIAVLYVTCENMKSRQKELQHKLVFTEEELKEKETEITCLLNKLEAMDVSKAKTIAEIEGKLINAQVAVAQKDAEVLQSETVIKLLQNEMISRKATISSQKKQINDLKEILPMEEDRPVESEKDDKVIQLENAIELLQDEIKSSHDTISSLTSKMSILQDQVAVLEREKGHVHSGNVIELLQKEIKSAHDTISSLTSERMRLKYKHVSQEEKKVEQSENANELLQNEIESTHNATISSFMSEKSTQQDQVGDSQSKKINEIVGKLLDAEEDLREKEIDIIQSEYIIEALEKQILSSQRTISFLSSENSRLQEQVKNLTNQTSVDQETKYISEDTQEGDGTKNINDSSLDPEEPVAEIKVEKIKADLLKVLYNIEVKDREIADLTASGANMILFQIELENQVIIANEALANKDMKIVSLSSELEIVLSEIEAKLMEAQKTIFAKDNEIAQLSAACETIEILQNEVFLSRASISSLTNENITLGQHSKSQGKRITDLQKICKNPEKKSSDEQDIAKSFLPIPPHNMQLDEARINLSWIGDKLLDIPGNNPATSIQEKTPNVRGLREDDQFHNGWENESSLSHTLLLATHDTARGAKARIKENTLSVAKKQRYEENSSYDKLKQTQNGSLCYSNKDRVEVSEINTQIEYYQAGVWTLKQT